MRDAKKDQDHRLALVTGASGAIGKYFEHMQMQPCRFGEDRVSVEVLYRACLAY